MQVEVEKVMRASPEKIYQMWTDPLLVSKWFGVHVEIDPRVGGNLKVDFGESQPTTGTFQELEPGKKIVFTWNSLSLGEPTGETLITITLKPAANGYTQMTLVHSGFASKSAQAEHKTNWKEYYSLWDRLLTQ